MTHATRTHLVTGAGSGIGEVVADRLHQRGDRLVLLARSGDRADHLADRFPGCATVVADLADAEALLELSGPAALASSTWPRSPRWTGTSGASSST